MKVTLRYMYMDIHLYRPLSSFTAGGLSSAKQKKILNSEKKNQSETKLT